MCLMEISTSFNHANKSDVLPNSLWNVIATPDFPHMNMSTLISYLQQKRRFVTNNTCGWSDLQRYVHMY